MSGSSSVPRIQVFRPTMEEFKNFSKYIEKIESMGAHKAGLAKIIPPDGWCPRKKGYDNIDIVIPAPISQVVSGRQGLYQQYNIQKKAMTVKEFKKLAEGSKFRTPTHFDYEDLERKYWKNITYNSPIYGADVSGSLYDDGVDEFNIQHLNTILDMVKEDYEIQIEGVNTAYLYFGMWKTTFAWHTEDMDLYSINYLHFGAPKSWYAIPPEHGRRLERLASNFFNGGNYCPAFLRHKMTIISPQILKQYSIPFNKITQEPGEFMITFPFGYHSGFNHGYNCAESTNFALPRWVEYGKRAVSCTCRNDCVKICMDMFVRKFQPERYEMWKIGRDIGPHPEDPSKVYAAPAPNKLELALAAQREERKKAKVANSTQKLKRHPISKVGKDNEKYKIESVTKEESEDSDTKGTEIYDVEEVFEAIDNENCVPVLDTVEHEEVVECDAIQIHASEIEPSDSVSMVDEDSLPKTTGEGKESICNNPPVLEEQLFEHSPIKCHIDLQSLGAAADNGVPSATNATSGASVINDDFLNEFPSFKQAISSGAVKLTCIKPVSLKPSTTSNTNVITIAPFDVSSEPASKTTGGQLTSAAVVEERACCREKIPNSFDGVLRNLQSPENWICEHKEGLKLKLSRSQLLQLLKQSAEGFRNAENPEQEQSSLLESSIDISTESLLSPCLSQTSVPAVVECSPTTSNSAPMNAETHFPTKHSDKPKEHRKHKKESRCSSSKTVNAASDSLDNWAQPILEMWQHRPFCFEEEQKFNMRCSMIEPYCSVCMIFSPIDFDKKYPNPQNTTIRYSKVRMPAFCFGNSLDNQMIMDQNPMLSRNGTSPLLVCANCKVSVHATCYGVTMIQMGSWICSRCASNAIDAECCLCVLRGGALKPTNDGRWAHVLCAVLIPETYFENVMFKEPINVTRLTAERQRLKCKYCFKSMQNYVKPSGSCVQCLSGKCYLPFHVTCGHMAGVVYEANDWPEPINIMCTRHVGGRRKAQKRCYTPVEAGDKVLSKYKNRRYYWVAVKQKYDQIYYSVLFEDNSTSTNTMPEDIVGRETSEPGSCPEINEKIKVKWTDGKTYSAIFKGSRSCEIFLVEFDDGTLVTRERHQIYASDEHLPREVTSKMSHASERRDPFKLESEGKRVRISNSRYRHST